MKDKEIPGYNLVLVKWVDSHGCTSNWGTIPDTSPSAHYCYSVGWLVAESDDCMVIIPHISPECEEINADEQGCGEMTIPKTSVKKITNIKT